MSERDYVGEALAASSGSGAHLITRCAADITPEPIEWLWPGRIPLGKQTLIAGEAGLGKSQLSIAIAAAVTIGGPWPCDEGRAPCGSVVFLSAEDGAADTIVPRLMAAGADLSRVHLINAVRSDDGKARRAFNLTADLALLEQKISEIGDVRLVNIDPISSYLGTKVDSHVNAAVRGTLEPIGEMAERHRVAILSITHPPKGAGTTAINRFIGSIAFVAAARAAFMVTKDSDDETRRLFLPVKNNLAPLGKGLAYRLEQRIVGELDRGIVASSAVWEPEPVSVTVDEALQATDQGGKPPGVEAEELLRSILADGPVPVTDIQAEAKAAGLTWATVRRAKGRLGVTAERESEGREGGGRWLWNLQGAHQGARGSPFKGEHLAKNEHLAEAGNPPAPALGPPGDSLDDLDRWPDLPAFLRRNGGGP